MSLSLVDKLNEAAVFLESKVGTLPKYVVTLGSGLSGLVDTMEKEAEFLLADIPHLRLPTVKGHAGKVVVGKLDGVRVLGMQGRLHYYEGYPMEDVVFPFRVFAFAGAEVFILTNASGGIDVKLRPADLVLLKDHINLMGDNPLIGANDERIGPRFPDLTDTYTKELRGRVKEIALKEGIALQEGVYCGCSGPSYETPAEIQMYRAMGATVVGMSTVPEAIAIRHMGKKIIGISCVTNQAAGITDAPLEHSDVLDVAKKAYPKLSRLIRETLKSLDA